VKINDYQKEVKLQKELLITLKALNKASYIMIDDIATKSNNSEFTLIDVKQTNRKIEKVIYKIACLTVLPEDK